MKTMKRSLRLLQYNISSVLLFEILYKLMTAALLTPVLYWMLQFTMQKAEIDYLNLNNIGSYLLSPATYLMLFLALIILSAYIMIQMSGLIYAYDASYKNRKINPVWILLKAIFNSCRVVRPDNLRFTAYVLLLLPFTYTITISASVAGIQIPDYLKSYLISNKRILALLIVAYGAASIFSMIRIFSLNYFTLYKCNYSMSVSKSKALLKKRVFRLFAGVLLLNAIITILLFGLEWVVVSGSATILKNVLPYKNFGFVLHTLIRVSFLVMYIIFSIISTPIICAYLSASFYELREKNEAHEEKTDVEDEDDERHKKLLHKKKSKTITVVLLVIGIILNGLYLYLDFSNRYRLNFWIASVPEVIAHRGDSRHAPENTMAAIRLAVENQADIIEIDVRQTKDGKYVLLHDENLKRTTGVDAKVGEVDYDFVASLDPGAYYSDEYKGERIPTLDEVLDYAAAEDVFLNIELKPASTDKEDYIEGVLRLIEAYDMTGRCVVASQSYSCLKQVKELLPDIKTVYIISMAIGDLGRMEYADVYSIRYNFVTATLVRNAHKNGIEVYAWTVNGEETIQNLMLMDVDSIITDSPYKTKKIVYASDENLVTEILKKLLKEY